MVFFPKDKSSTQKEKLNTWAIEKLLKDKVFKKNKEIAKVELDGFKSLGKYFSLMVLPTCVTKSLLFAYQIPSPHTVLWNGKDEKILLNPNFMTWNNKNYSWTKTDFFFTDFYEGIFN